MEVADRVMELKKILLEPYIRTTTEKEFVLEKFENEYDISLLKQELFGDCPWGRFQRIIRNRSGDSYTLIGGVESSGIIFEKNELLFGYCFLYPDRIWLLELEHDMLREHLVKCKSGKFVARLYVYGISVISSDNPFYNFYIRNIDRITIGNPNNCKVMSMSLWDFFCAFRLHGYSGE